MSDPLEALRVEVELAGCSRTSPFFEIKVRQRQVERCKDQRGLASCTHQCSHYEHCEVVKEHLVDVRYRLPALQKEHPGEEKTRDNPWLRD